MPCAFLHNEERLHRGKHAEIRGKCKVRLRIFIRRYVALVPQQRESMGTDGFRILYLPMQSK